MMDLFNFPFTYEKSCPLRRFYPRFAVFLLENRHMKRQIYKTPQQSHRIFILSSGATLCCGAQNLLFAFARQILTPATAFDFRSHGSLKNAPLQKIPPSVPDVFA
ncbi:MAG: hypothetical protein E7467_01565 [Ruminococcaceae bacterium]|nr:hypothetical protein [Oscillospiraceae bacterium]